MGRQMPWTGKEAPKPCIEPLSSYGTVKRKAAETIRKWSADKALTWWKSSLKQTQAKKFIKECISKFTENINKGRRTGHYRLNKHLSNFGLTENGKSKICQTEEETW